MNCEQVHELLVDLLYEELDAGERGLVMAHLETCRTCQLRWSRVRALAAAADRWASPSVSRGVAERALIHITAERHAARAPLGSSATMVGRVLLGGSAALLSLLLVVTVVSRPTTVVGAAALAVVWTVLYSAVFLAAQHPSTRGLTRAALMGCATALLVVPAMTISSVVDACERWMRAAQGSVPMALLLVVGAAGYTAAPLLIGSLGARPQSDGEWVSDGLKLSALYALLIAPAVALQCVALPPQITVLWMTGALVGAAAAGPIGLRLGRWRRQAIAK